MIDLKDVIARWYGDAVLFLPNLLLVAVILSLTLLASRYIQEAVRRISRRTSAPAEIGELLGRIARIGILTIGMLLVLQRIGWGETVLSFVAGLGVVGLVVGFALQDIVKQFAAGVLLLMLRPFRVGDDVRITGFEGTVVAVQLRATVLRTANGDEVQIPNADVYTTAIVNMSRYNVRRHVITLSVPREANLEQTHAALTRAIKDVPGVAVDPPPVIAGTSFDGASVKIELRFWVDEHASRPETVTTEVIAAAGRVLA
jgi:small conductance mechanosensitive channel